MSTENTEQAILIKKKVIELLDKADLSELRLIWIFAYNRISTRK